MTRALPRLVTQTPTARSLALQVLLDCRRSHDFAQDILDRHFARVPLAAADRRLATQLVYGVIRRRDTLDALLRPRINRPVYRVEPWLWDALRLGVHQLALLSHIPPHAAVHETVELANAFGRPASRGFLNGVLRGVERMLTNDWVEQPAADALPVADGRYRRLREPVLPLPADHPLEYLAAAFSLPAWLVERWHHRYGWDECVRLGLWFAGQAPLWLRSNSLVTDRERLLEELRKADIEASPGEHPQAVRLDESAVIWDLPGFEQGWFTVQDESAMGVGSALAPAPGERVLDLCAAPGTKTTHLAESMHNQGQILACDVDADRLQTVRTLCQRLRIDIVETRQLDRSGYEGPPAGPFDAILVDVPCSNTGVLGRRPEVRWRLRPEDFRNLVPLQTKLLLQAAERIRPGGAIVYSTCSIEPEENRAVVEAVLLAMSDLRLEADQSQAPGRPADGGYWARLRRKGL